MGDKEKNLFTDYELEDDDEDDLQDEDETSLDTPLDELKQYALLQDSPMRIVSVSMPSNLQEDILDMQAIDNALSVGTNADAVMEQIEQYTDDEDVLEDFGERQQVASGGDELLQKLLQYNSKSPELSGGDIDAAWEDTDQSGEESVGGSVATPDQDRVDELGAAVGLNYVDGEPLHTYDKLVERDQHRWELDPRSADEDNDEQAGMDETDEFDDEQESLDALDEFGYADEEDLDELEELDLLEDEDEF